MSRARPKPLHVPIKVSLGTPHAEGECPQDCPASGEHTRGPAKVTSEAYRKGFDAIFGRQKVGQA